MIGGERFADDFEVIWRGLVIGRMRTRDRADIEKARRVGRKAAMVVRLQRACRPQAAGDRGHDIDLKDCQTRFKILWARIRAQLTDEGGPMACQCAKKKSPAKSAGPSLSFCRYCRAPSRQTETNRCRSNSCDRLLYRSGSIPSSCASRACDGSELYDLSVQMRTCWKARTP
jgi:hypothetical protein